MCRVDTINNDLTFPNCPPALLDKEYIRWYTYTILSLGGKTMQQLKDYRKIDHLRSINKLLGNLYYRVETDESESLRLERRIQILESFVEEYRLSPVTFDDSYIVGILDYFMEETI